MNSTNEHGTDYLDLVWVLIGSVLLIFGLYGLKNI